MRNVTNLAARVLAIAAFAVAATGMIATPAIAGEAGIISKYRGNYPSYGSCVEFGVRAQAREMADGYRCYGQSNGTYDLYLSWNT